MKTFAKTILLCIILLNVTFHGLKAQDYSFRDVEASGNAREAIQSLNIQPDETIPYKKIGDVSLSLSVFNPPAGVTKPTACVVFFFGGAFKIGTPDQFYPQCQYLASRGIVAISVEYRTESKHGTKPDASLADAKSGMRWIRSHAQELNIDPSRIAVGGNSAGGYLAAAMATIEKYDEVGEDTTVSCLPDALLVFYGTFDRGPGSRGYNATKRLFKGDENDFSPLHNIRPGFPPTVYFLGTEDGVVSVEDANKIKTEIEKVGSRCDLHIYEGQRHGFTNFGWKDGKHYYLVLDEVDNFLVSIGWLSEKK